MKFCSIRSPRALRRPGGLARPGGLLRPGVLPLGLLALSMAVGACAGSPPEDRVPEPQG